MKLSTSIWIAAIFVIVAGGAWWVSSHPKTRQVEAADFKTATYTVEGQAAQYFGNDATGDLNGDGVPDAAFIVTQSPGGSGTFYYVIAALKTASGYTSTNAVLLGDRIAPQTTQIQNGEVIVNYADRKPGDPMTAQPSVGVSKYLKVEGGVLTEVQP